MTETVAERPANPDEQIRYYDVVSADGTWDILTGAGDMRSAAERIAGSTFIEFPGSHFLMIEYPDEIHEALLAFVGRTLATP